MKCPDCKGCELEPVLSRQGLVVECCPKCHGVWLERGEIYLLAHRPEIASRRLKEAEKISKSKISPKTNTAMNPVNYPEGVEVYICDSGGIWIDGKQMKKCSNIDDNMMLDLGILGAYAEDMQDGLSSAVGCPNTYAEVKSSGQVPDQWITILILVFISIGMMGVWLILS